MHGFEINPLPKLQFKYTSNNVPNELSATEGSMKSFDKLCTQKFQIRKP